MAKSAISFTRTFNSYVEKVVPILLQEFPFKNIHQVPKIEKIVVKCRSDDGGDDISRGLQLEMITGQKPMVKKDKNAAIVRKDHKVIAVKDKSISVTLRGNMMYSFLDRLISLDLPSTADPEGVKKPYHFDRLGNYKISLRDSSAFPEIRNEHFSKQIGMDICINTTASTGEQAQRLIGLMGMPI